MTVSDANDLYGLPPAEFTRARDELARRLRKEGRREEADAVKGLRKPSVAAWAVNQLAHRRPEEIERLLAAGARLREAQEALLSGGGRAALQQASTEERELVDRLTRDATAVAGEARTSAAGTLVERDRGTLHAAALDEQTASELAAGRLEREREAVGLFGTGAPTEVRGAPARRPSKAETRGTRTKRGDGDARKAAERRRAAEQELAGARSAEQKASREHADAAKAVERVAKRLENARARAEEARARADEALAELREAERRQREAAKARERAARAVAAAERKQR